MCITTAPCKQTQTYLRVEVGLPVICSAIGLKHYISLVLLFHFYSSQCIVSSTQNNVHFEMENYAPELRLYPCS